MSMIHFMFTHGDAVVTLLVAVIGVVKLTAWGQANAEALSLLVDVIEQKNSTDIKKTVASLHGDLSKVAQDVLEDAVNTADEKKKALPTVLRVCREVFRGLFPVRQ
jgi:Mor family transcriptional regulator